MILEIVIRLPSQSIILRKSTQALPINALLDHRASAPSSFVPSYVLSRLVCRQGWCLDIRPPLTVSASHCQSMLLAPVLVVFSDLSDRLLILALGSDFPRVLLGPPLGSSLSLQLEASMVSPWLSSPLQGFSSICLVLDLIYSLTETPPAVDFGHPYRLPIPTLCLTVCFPVLQPTPVWSYPQFSSGVLLELVQLIGPKHAFILVLLLAFGMAVWIFLKNMKNTYFSSKIRILVKMSAQTRTHSKNPYMSW